MESQIKNNYSIKCTLREYIIEKIKNKEEGWTLTVPNSSTESSPDDSIEIFKGIFRSTLINFLTNSISEGIMFLATPPEENHSGHDYPFGAPFVINKVRNLNFRSAGRYSLSESANNSAYILETNGDNPHEWFIYPGIENEGLLAEIRVSYINYDQFEKGNRDFRVGNNLYLDDLLIVEPYDDNLFYTSKLSNKVDELNSEIQTFQKNIEIKKNEINSISMILDFMIANKMTKEPKSNIKSSLILESIKNSNNEDALTEISEIIDINI